MAVILPFSRPCVGKVIRISRLVKWKAQAVMPVMSMHLFVPAPGLQTEIVPLNTILRAWGDGKAHAVPGLKVEIVDEIIRIDHSVVRAPAGVLRLMRVFDNRGVVVFCALKVQKIAIDVEVLLCNTWDSQTKGSKVGVKSVHFA